MTDGVLIVVASIAIAWLVAGATVVRLVSRIWLRHWAERGLRGAAAASASVNRPQRLLASATVAIGLVLALAGAALASRPPTGVRSIALLLACCAAAVVFLAQVLARAVARHWTAALAPATLPALRVAEVVAWPVLWCSRAIRRAPSPRAPLTPEAERTAMEQLMRESELEGVTGPDDAAIITGVVAFGDKRVGEVMTRREQIFAVREGLNAQEAAELVARSAFSRVPVYRGTLDHVTGVIHAFDLLRGAEQAMAVPRPVAWTAPETMCNALLFEMLRDHRHLAVVRDRSGRTVGLVTLEDLLEELVGDIRDEHDEPAPAPA